MTSPSHSTTVYASAAVNGCRRALVVCPASGLLVYGAAGRLLCYCPTSGCVVGLSCEVSDGTVTCVRHCRPTASVPASPTFLATYSSGSIAVWQQEDRTLSPGTVRQALHRKLFIKDVHGGSALCGDGCFLQPVHGTARLLIASAGLDHAISLQVADLGTGEVVSSRTVPLRDRFLIQELRLLPMPLSSSPSALPLLLYGGDDSKVHILAHSARSDGTSEPAAAKEACDQTLPSANGCNEAGPMDYEEVAAISGHQDWVTCLDYITLGCGSVMLASGSKDGSVRVWRLQLTPLDSDGASSSLPFKNNEDLCTSGGQAQLRVAPILLRGGRGSVLLETVLIGHDGWVAHLNWLLVQGEHAEWREGVDASSEGDPYPNPPWRGSLPRLASGGLGIYKKGHWITVPQSATDHGECSERNLRLLSCAQTEDRAIILWQPQGYQSSTEPDPSEGGEGDDDEEEEVWVEAARLGEVGGNREGFFSALFSPDGASVYAHSYQGGLHAWRLSDKDTTWEPRPTPSGHFRPVADLAWEAGHGRYLLTTSLDQTTRLHSAAATEHLNAQGLWHEVCRPQVHGYDLSCVASLGADRLVAGAEEKVVRVFAAPTRLFQRLDALCGWQAAKEIESRPFVDAAAVPSLGLSNKSVVEQQQAPPTLLGDGLLTEDSLMAGSLWPEISKLYGHGHELHCVAASRCHIASACRAATLQDAAIIIWCAQSLRQLQCLPHHRLTVTQLCFNGDHTRLLAVSRDRGWSLYSRTDSDTEPYCLSSHSGLVGKSSQHSRIIWAADWLGNSFITASRDKTLVLWGTDDPSAEPSTPTAALPTANGGAQRPLTAWVRLATVTEMDEVTAVATAPATQNNWIIATGLVTGKLKVHLYSQALRQVLTTHELTPSHHDSVRRLAFQPRGGDRPDKQIEEAHTKDTQERLLLASCANDHLACIYDCTKYILP